MKEEEEEPEEGAGAEEEEEEEEEVVVVVEEEEEEEEVEVEVPAAAAAAATITASHGRGMLLITLVAREDERRSLLRGHTLNVKKGGLRWKRPCAERAVVQGRVGRAPVDLCGRGAREGCTALFCSVSRPLLMPSNEGSQC